MGKAFLGTIVALLTGVSVATAAGPEIKTDEQKTLYALGLALSNSLAPFALNATELELVKAGLTDGTLHKDHPGIDVQTYGPKIQALQRSRAAVVAAAEKKTGQAFLDKAAKEKGATRTPSGLVIVSMKAGTGPAPAASDTVKVQYQGTLTDGTVFDSSIERGQPATFALNRVIKCFSEGLQLMKVGGKSRLVCPADLAYGDGGVPPRIKPGATLIFEVELLEIVKQP
jgi:FKBP-type peptidyl-prolyl cis-trans isomerase FkpA/FKBP-type peptidyl-prolyl cis-trans isomerase FklB